MVGNNGKIFLNFILSSSSTETVSEGQLLLVFLEIFSPSMDFASQTLIYEVTYLPWCEVVPLSFSECCWCITFLAGHSLFLFISLKVLRVRFHGPMSFHYFNLWVRPEAIRSRKFFLSKIWQVFIYSASKICFKLILKSFWNLLLYGLRWDHTFFFSSKTLVQFYRNYWATHFIPYRLVICTFSYIKLSYI